MILAKLKGMFNKEKNEKDVYYLVKYQNDNVFYIIEQKLLELMLMEGVKHESFMNSGYVGRLGWHIGEDDKVYERLALNDFGKYYYSRIQEIMMRDSKAYLAALYEIQTGRESRFLKNERKVVEKMLEENLVESISSYTRKEMQKPRQANENEQNQAL